MSYTSGTITSATPSTVLLAAIETEMTNHPAWEFVEEYVDGTYTNRIWKNLGTENDWGQDYYVALMRLTSGIGANPIIIKAAEQYSTSTHLAIRNIGPSSSTAVTPAATYASYNETGLSFTNSVIFSPSITVQTTAFTYHIGVTANWFSVYNTTMSTTYGPLITGLYTSFWVTDWPDQEFPLVSRYAFHSSTSGGGAYSRRPGRIGVATNYCFNVCVATGLAYTNLIGNIGTTHSLLGSKLYGSPYATSTYLDSSNSAGPAKGIIPDMLIFGYSTTPALGDTLTVDAETWTCLFVHSSSTPYIGSINGGALFMRNNG